MYTAYDQQPHNMKAGKVGLFMKLTRWNYGPSKHANQEKLFVEKPKQLETFQHITKFYSRIK